MKTQTAVLLGVGAGVIVLGAWIAKSGAKVAQAVNPLNHDNVFATGTDKVLQATGAISPDDSLGTAIYNATHNDDGSFNWFGLSSSPAITAPTTTTAPAKKNPFLDWGTSGGDTWQVEPSANAAAPTDASLQDWTTGYGA